MELNTKRISEHLERIGMTLSDLSESMGHSPSYMSQALRQGKMPTSQYRLMCHVLRVDEDFFNTPAPKMYRLNLIYSDRKVCVQLMHGEEVVCGAWSLLKGDSQKDFIQAISYASHMMYKLAEQKQLDGEEKEYA